MNAAQRPRNERFMQQDANVFLRKKLLGNMGENDMKMIISGAMAIVIGLGAVSVPAMAKSNQSRYQYNGRGYATLAQCQSAKRKAGRDGAIVGAATAGIGSAILGANLGEAALIAGGGALVGNQLGRARKC